jgi:acyl-CoA thioester hydrolase
MLCYRIEPRSSETNATGHIDHTAVPEWFEQARTPIYRIFNPSLSFASWNTVIRRIVIEFLGQIFHDRETEVITAVGTIKNTSLTVLQELWQDGVKVATAETVPVYFDYRQQRKLHITPTLRNRPASVNAGQD